MNDVGRTFHGSQNGAHVVQFQDGPPVIYVLQLLEHVLERLPHLVHRSLAAIKRAHLFQGLVDCVFYIWQAYSVNLLKTILFHLETYYIVGRTSFRVEFQV